MLLIIIIFKIFIFIEVQGYPQNSSCLPIRDACSIDSECCTKKCFTATCVLNHEKSENSPSASALSSDIFFLNTECFSNKDCNYLQSCVLINVTKGVGACTRIPNLSRTPPDKSFGNRKPETCVKKGSSCHENFQCCSKDCNESEGPGFCDDRKKYIRTTTALSVEIPSYCIKDGHFCLSDSDCCSRDCLTIAMTKLHYCRASRKRS